MLFIVKVGKAQLTKGLKYAHGWCNQPIICLEDRSILRSSKKRVCFWDRDVAGGRVARGQGDDICFHPNLIKETAAIRAGVSPREARHHCDVIQGVGPQLTPPLKWPSVLNESYRSRLVLLHGMCLLWASCHQTTACHSKMGYMTWHQSGLLWFILLNHKWRRRAAFVLMRDVTWVNGLIKKPCQFNNTGTPKSHVRVWEEWKYETVFEYVCGPH